MKPLLLRIPRELRDLIWTQCVDYPDMSVVLEKNISRAKASFVARFGPGIPFERIEELLPWSNVVQPEPLPMTTPSILLVNHQIYTEAIAILRKRTLGLEIPVPANFWRESRDVSITDFVGEETLQSVRLVSLKVSFQTLKESNEWYRTINQLCNIWRTKHQLQLLMVLVEPICIALLTTDDSLKDQKGLKAHVLYNVSSSISLCFLSAC
jgi:hypothetical protein